jgi:peptide/nickel transport system permease protein
MTNSRYVARRLVQVVPTVSGILVVVFFLIHLAPGDPVEALAGQSGDAAYYEFMRRKFGLDRPLLEQFFTYAGNILRGDLGISFIHGRQVADVILERLPATLLLMGTAIVLSSLGGIVLGTLAARRPFGRLDLTVGAASLVGYAAPSFWLAQLAVLGLSFYAGAFPIQGMTDARTVTTGFAHALDVAHHLVLPALVLALQELALVVRLTRAGLLEASGRDFLRTARAKGLAESRVITRHALPNALLPVVTIVGGRLGFLFSGAVVVEIVFGWPGLGRVLLSATLARDYPILLGILMLVAFSVVFANLLMDLVYARLDPRIRLN